MCRKAAGVRRQQEGGQHGNSRSSSKQVSMEHDDSVCTRPFRIVVIGKVQCLQQRCCSDQGGARAAALRSSTLAHIGTAGNRGSRPCWLFSHVLGSNLHAQCPYAIRAGMAGCIVTSVSDAATSHSGVCGIIDGNQSCHVPCSSRPRFIFHCCTWVMCHMAMLLCRNAA